MDFADRLDIDLKVEMGHSFSVNLNYE